MGIDYDVMIIGAGPAGLAAALRAGIAGKKTVLIERHNRVGGLNSYYRLDDRWFDTGLHAMTNFAPKSDKGKPFNRLFRQLRMDTSVFDFREQTFSLVKFPGKTLKFNNNFEVLRAEVAAKFPDEAENFTKLAAELERFDPFAPNLPEFSAREFVAGFISDKLLTDMIFFPTMYYGNPRENDMDFALFAIMFDSLFRKGLVRPAGGIRQFLNEFVKKIRAAGVDLRLKSPVLKIIVENGAAKGVLLESGETVTAGEIISTAGLPETAQLINESDRSAELSRISPGVISFAESINVLNRPARDFGIESSTMFYNTTGKLDYSMPKESYDTGDGVICCPDNFDGITEPDKDAGGYLLRISCRANFAEWRKIAESPDKYRATKDILYNEMLARAESFFPGVSGAVIAHDIFTPLTINRFTGRINGAIYGSPWKSHTGLTGITNLHIGGTDQGWLGLFGSMFSGVHVVNKHVLGLGQGGDNG